MIVDETQWLALLKKRFGFASFRPLQKEIIHDAVNGRDVFALLPTGGGKSLCFQMPALICPNLTVVASPLIALMKDQVDALQASGIPATFLNSSLNPTESRRRLYGLHTGQYRLLYVAPERLMLSGFMEDIKKWNPNLIAVDEAHCISEWGHDFRPEYRQLARLREFLPQTPMMALTATATHRVRADILTQLRLRDPKCYVASFNRPNLTYRVVAKSKPSAQVLQLLRARPHDSGIVYCQSRNSAEKLAEFLGANRVQARPYHAGLTSGQRTENQEAFLRDEVRVICATIAFGMGINKPNVRFVIHYDLPKNIEGYYQETGRAGRDGLPSDCVLLFSASDVVKQTGFIDEKTDPREQKIAREQLQQMVHYAEASNCRRVELLEYFGETHAEENCGGCDNCLTPPQAWDGTVAAQKMLSAIYRLWKERGQRYGAGHLIDILRGKQTPRVLEHGHASLSVFGIGQDLSEQAWRSVLRQLLAYGLLMVDQEGYGTLALTDQSRAVLKGERMLMLRREAERTSERSGRTSSTPRGKALQPELPRAAQPIFEALRNWRAGIARSHGVPAYVIFHDATLREIALARPDSLELLSHVNGVGVRKLESYGESILACIAEFEEAE
ncbi:MAG: DNA helicase RecQ [Alcaligenaceae bacterium]